MPPKRPTKRAVTLRPQYWATHVWLGTFYREHGRYADAAREYELAIALTPDNARAYYILGNLYFTVGRYDEAIAACQKSAALVPSIQAFGNWGATLSRLRRFNEAADMFEQGRRLGPEDYRIDGNLARAYYWSGRRAEADGAVPAGGRSGDADAQRQPAGSSTRASAWPAFYAKLADRDRAIAEMRRLPADLSDPHVLVFGAAVYMDLSDREAALASLERAAGRRARAQRAQGLDRTWIR